MIGILILIPIIIVFIVAMVSAIVSTQAWISVEDLKLQLKGTDIEAEKVSYSLDELGSDIVNLYDKIDVIVLPEKANRYVIEWQIVGDITYTDQDYKAKYDKYLQEYAAKKAEIESVYSKAPYFSDSDMYNAYNKALTDYGSSADSAKIISAMANELVGKVYPAAALVDSFGDETTSNSSGLIRLSWFCHFTIKVTAENVSKTLLVSVGGDNVKIVNVTNLKGDDKTTLGVGESKRITASYTPIESIVNYTIWHALDEDIATIDQNGVITAKKTGTARFTMQASVHSTDKSDNIQYVTSNVYTIQIVAEGASLLFGSKIASHKRQYTLQELGINDAVISVEGATITDDTLVANDGASQIVITTANGTLTVDICDEDAIAIQNADFFKKESNYVVAVDEHTLKLRAIWASVFKDGAPKVTWSSSNEDVARVNERGEVQGVGIGDVVITAECGEYQTQIALYVQYKIASLQLRTSNASLAVGLARQTVFASERYEDLATKGNAKVPNYTSIVVWGEPKNATIDQMRAFYAAYNFEIIEGGEYAYFDSEDFNKLVFNPETLKLLETSENLKTIKVKVSAKYPKHEGATEYTQESVDINVTHGVAVYNMDELHQAGLDQKAYTGVNEIYDRVPGAKLYDDIQTALENDCPENLIAPEKIFHHEVSATKDTYEVWTNPTSKRTYSISLMANCAFDTSTNEDGTPKHIVNWTERPEFYGDVYGNNRMISAITGQIDGELIRISWGNVKMSNVILRSNTTPESGTISTDDTLSFKGRVVKVGSDVNWDWYRLENVKFEYCILENGQEGLDVRNTNISFDGCIIRNLMSCGLSVMNRMYADDKGITHPFYSHVSFHNFISSNTLASVLVATFEKFTYSGTDKGRFVTDDLVQNQQYFVDNFAKPDSENERERHNFELNQSGILEIYNWQNIEYASIFDTGNKVINDLIATQTSLIIRENPSFGKYRYIDKDGKCYVHVAFVFAAVTLGSGLQFIVEPTPQTIRLEDTMLSSLNSKDIAVTENGGLGEDILRMIGVTIYGYQNTAKILPHTTYQVNTALINRLHG